MDGKNCKDFRENDHIDMDVDSAVSETNEEKDLKEEDKDFSVTMIVHAVTSEEEKVYHRNKNSAPMVQSKPSKEIAGNEVVSVSKLKKQFENTGFIRSSNECYGTIERDQKKGIVKPKVRNENYKSGQHLSPEKAFSNINDLFTVKKDNGNIQEKRKIEDALSSDTLSSEDSLSELIDSPVLENMESFLILDDLEEYGAVGGRDAVSDRTSTNSTQKDVCKSSKENLSGILHRKSSINRKPSSVQFDESVAIETFSQTEPASDCSPKAILAQGDGPDPNQAPVGMFGPFPGPVSVTRLNDLSERAVTENKDSERNTLESRNLNDTASGHASEVSSRRGSFQRKDSTPRMLSPTELLRQKQKIVADKIIHSLSVKSGDSKKDLEQSSPGHIVTDNDDFSQEDGTYICERHSDVEDTWHYSDSLYKNRVDNDNNIQATAKNQSHLVKVNSSDFIDPKFLHNLPDIQNNFFELHKKWRDLDEKTQENHKKPYKEQPESNISTLELTKPIAGDEKKNAEVSSVNIDDQPQPLAEKLQDRKMSNNRLKKSEISVEYESTGMAKMSESQPGYWFFNSTDTPLSGSYDEDEGWKIMPYPYNLNDPDRIPVHVCDIQDLTCTDEAIAEKIQRRLTRKRRLDSLRDMTYQHSCSSLLMHENSSAEIHTAEKPTEICTDTVLIDDGVLGDSETTDEDRENSNVEEHGNNYGPRKEELYCDGAQEAVDYMNSLLTEFIDMIEYKSERGMAITVDDYKELELIQSTIIYIGNRLTALTETAESVVSNNSQIESLKEGGSSQIFIDLHDRNMITMYLKKLKMSLSNTQKKMWSLSDSMMNERISENLLKTDNNKEYETKSASENVYTYHDQRYPTIDYSQLGRNDKSGRKKLETLANERETDARNVLKEANRQAYTNEILQHNFKNLCQSQHEKDKSDSSLCVKCVDNESSGYLGDRSESESSITATKTHQRKTRQDASGLQSLDTKTQDESPMVEGRSKRQTVRNRDAVVMPEFMTVSPFPYRDNQYTFNPYWGETHDTGENSYRTHLHEERQMYPEYYWSRLATENTVKADSMFPDDYIADSGINDEGLSSEQQLLNKYGKNASNVQFTSNPYYKAQSGSEFGNDDDEETGKTCYTMPNNVLKMTEGMHPNVIVSPRKIKLLTCVTVPDDLRGVRMDLGSASLTVKRQADEDPVMVTASGQDMNKEFMQKEGSPERGQRLYGSSQNLERRGDAGVTKRKQAGARSVTPDSRGFLMEREVNESQNRKLQMEISTLQTENKLLKEKNNRSQARIVELETQLAEAQDDLNTLQDNLNQEVSDLSIRTKQEIERGRDEMNTKILVLTKENESLKAEVSSLEKRLQTSQRVTDMARHNSEKARTIDAYKLEVATMKEELNSVKALLEQSEKHLREEEERHTETSKQVLKLTELKNALQQQSDAGGSGAILNKQMKSLEKRLKVTEERLHQERADRANNLSAVEDKLLTDNSRLQAAEKDLKRQLQREKEKNRNLDHRVKLLREENEKLRIALPFDESVLTSDKGKYDIPYGSHSSQRAETLKNISDDMNYILSRIEKQDGLSAGQEEEIICTLWNKRELAYKHLREYELQIEELKIHDNNNIVDGLKNLRDTYSQSEAKLRIMEEKVEDIQAQLATSEATYKEQLNGLVQERHDAFAKLRTAEDLLEAVRVENEILRKNVALSQVDEVHGQGQLTTGDTFEALKHENITLEGRVAQLKRSNEKLEGELTTTKVQLDARNKALQDVQSELDLAYNRLQGEEVDDRKQIKIDKLTAQVNNFQIELKSWTDKYNHLVTEKSKLETELSLLKKSTSPTRGRHQKMEQIDSKVLQQMRDDILEKESRLSTINKQLEDTENELQKVRQELYVEQMHNSELEDELDTLQHTANQRAQMFEALSGTEREQLAQYQILKETLDSVNQELAQKQAQIISLDVNLSGQRDKTVELEHEVEKLKREGKDKDDLFTEDEQNSAHQLKIKVLEQERAQLKQELSQAYNAIQAAEEQYRTLQTESSQIEQELVKEKTIILQITAEKGEVEQHLEELAEEHDALIQEKSLVEEDLIKLETKLQEILQKYEAEAKKQHDDFAKQYPTLPPEGRKLVSELDSLRLVVEGKNREIEMLQDKLNRANIEIDFLNRKVELVHNDSISNREDVARMISELTLKMKEAVTTREVNQYLVEERTKLQNEKSHLERELEQERKTNDERKKEITDVISKIERTETHKKSAEKDSKDKEGKIATLEAELHSSKHSFDVMETEYAQLKNKLEHLNNDLQNLMTINDSLEKQLEMEKVTLSDEKSNMGKIREDHSSLCHNHQLLQHDHRVLSEKYEAELKNVENLRRGLDEVKKENDDIREQLQKTKIDLDSQTGQLVITKESVQKLTQDKGSIYQDYESMCRTLTEKERQLNELRSRSEEKLELVKREHDQEKLRLGEHRNTAVQECEMAKKEMNSLVEQLKQKEIQLNTFGKTLQELERVTRERKALESQVQRLESTSGDSRLLLEGQRKEIMALNENFAKQQEKSIRLESENHTLQADLKSEKDNANREIHELKLTINEMKSQHENERHYLNDNLAQTQNRLRSVETSLAAVSKERDQLHGQQVLNEKTVVDLQAQLSDESTGRRLAEQSVGTLRLQLEDTKNAKNVAEAKVTEMQAQINKAENQFKTERDRTQRLLGKVQELQAVSQTSESSVRAKSEQVDTLQKEINKLKQLLDSQKQGHLGKMKKSALEFKQQLDLAQEEKDKLVLQVQQIAADLDSCREQVANKNKENLKLQEEFLMMEDSLRESKLKQKQAEENLRIETEKQTQLSSRFRDQDDELKRLRNFLAKKVEESGDADKSMWHEMNRVIQELSKQMQNHLDAQKAGSGKDSEGQSVVRYKKQIAELQGELNTEKSLHQITKTSLQALEEDCQRLRQQLQTWRRRDPHTLENKYKNRMEAINAIIARSQSQAQALLASGGYIGNTMLSPRIHQNRPGLGSPQHIDSPDNSFSEDLSIASLPPLHYGSATKHP